MAAFFVPLSQRTKQSAVAFKSQEHKTIARYYILGGNILL